MVEPRPLLHLSHSSVQLYSDCSWAWRGRYRDGVKSDATPPLVTGSVVDATLERVFKAKAKGEMLDLNATYQEEWAAYVETNAGFINWNGDPPESVETVGAKLMAHKDAAALVAKLMPLVDEQGPVLQRKIVLRVPGVPIPVEGWLDIVTDDGVPGDFKTAGRAWTAEQAEHEMQPRIYLAAMMQAGWPLPQGLKFRHYVFVKSRAAQVQTFETTYTPAQIFMAMRSIAAAWRGIDAGVFVPNPKSWLCSEKFCTLWATCMGAK